MCWHIVSVNDTSVRLQMEFGITLASIVLGLNVARLCRKANVFHDVASVSESM